MASPRPSKKEKIATDIIPVKYQHAVSILILFLSLIIFFNELVFEGKVFVAADNIASKSFQTLVSDAESQGIFPLWNPYIFCGMPGYASLMVHGERFFDISATVLNRLSVFFGTIIQSPDAGWGLFYYLILGSGIYFFVFDKVKNKIAALLAGLTVMHSTFIVILIMVGHMTKVPVIAFFPWIFLIVERLREKFSLLSLMILILLTHFMLLPGHLQMIFYVYLSLGFYYLFFFVHAIITKSDWKGLLRSGGMLTLATILAFLMTGDQYLSTLEYSKYSMRGADPIVPSQQAVEKGATNGGLDYDYATQWSFSPGEALTFAIPSLYGFGNVTYQGILTQNQAIRINTYLGPQPFTDAPQYMGIVILILAGIGFWINRKKPFVLFSGSIVLFSLLISFGKEFSLLYDLFFNYFPMFNKFRIPSMILVIVQIFIPILAAYGLESLLTIQFTPMLKKRWQYALTTLGGLLIVTFMAKGIVSSVYESFFSKTPFIQKGYQDAVATELFNFVTTMVVNDVIIALLLLFLMFGAFFLFWKRTISLPMVAVGILMIAIIDLWRVNFQPMDPQPHTTSAGYFAAPDYVKFLQQDTTLYRTLQFERGQPPYDNTLAYWRIQSAYGYSGTKMRQIQDVFDVCGIGNPLLWGLMNVKYIISDRADSNQILKPVFNGEKNILYNAGALPRTFFVSRYTVASGIDILNSIKAMNFDPRETGFFMEDPQVSIDPPGEGAKADVVHSGLHELEIKATATGNNLLFLSETWYPEGWKAYLDGVETPIYRMNYMFRGVVIPAGEHSLVMKFEPKGFFIGKMLSLWINILVLAGMVVVLFMHYRSTAQKNK